MLRLFNQHAHCRPEELGENVERTATLVHRPAVDRTFLQGFLSYGHLKGAQSREGGLAELAQAHPEV